jgi:hypothetical protein
MGRKGRKESRDRWMLQIGEKLSKKDRENDKAKKERSRERHRNIREPKKSRSRERVELPIASHVRPAEDTQECQQINRRIK